VPRGGRQRPSRRNDCWWLGVLQLPLPGPARAYEISISEWYTTANYKPGIRQCLLSLACQPRDTLLTTGALAGLAH
jgi:hypothetical protein